MEHIRFRVPDRIFAIIAVIVLAITWGLMIWAWPILPDRIPSHFTWTGAPDAWTTKNLWSVFFPVFLVTLMGGVIRWLYRSNRSFNIPSSVKLEAMPEPERTILTGLGKHMLTMVYVILTLIFAYIGLGTVSVAVTVETRLNSGILFFLVALLLAVVGVYISWMHKVAKLGAQKLQSNSEGKS